jgi:hypothetical protein
VGPQDTPESTQSGDVLTGQQSIGESARCLAGDGPGARRAQPATTREAARAGDGSFEVDTADPTSRLPPIEVDCGLLARHSPTHRSSQRPTAQNAPGAGSPERTGLAQGVEVILPPNSRHP